MLQSKQIFDVHILKTFLNNEKNCVSLVPDTRMISLPPCYLNDMRSGVLYILNSMLKKYDRALDGIVIGYENIKILIDDNTGIIPIGTPETEVKISADFYIFQPRIGAWLEGVINKTSTDHIGCLVHQYFNATILKPNKVKFKNWICKDFSVNDKITFKVKDLDFTTLLPYIEGVIEDENLTQGESDSCDETSDSTDEISDSSDETNDSSDETSDSSDETSDSSVSTDSLKKELTKKISIYEVGNSEEKKEKIKKQNVSAGIQKENSFIEREAEEVVYLSEEDGSLKSFLMSTESVDSSQSSDFSEYKGGKNKEKRKKKKEKEMEKEEDEDKKSAIQKSFNSDIYNEKKKPAAKLSVDALGALFKKYGEYESESSSDFSTPKKVKKEENKNKRENKSDSKSDQCLPPKEDNIFHSSQLDPSSESKKKMKTSLCGPIPKSVPSKTKEDENTKMSVFEEDKEKEAKNEKKKKKGKKAAGKEGSKKRSREEDAEVENSCKKIKTCDSTVDNNNLEMNTLFEEMNQVKSNSEISEDKRLKMKKKEIKESLGQVPQDKNTMNVAKRIEGESLLDEKPEEKLTKKKESSCLDEKENANGNEKKRKRAVKRKRAFPLDESSESEGEEKTGIQKAVDDSKKEESQVKEKVQKAQKAHDKSAYKQKKSKAVKINEETEHSLCEKLLKEAKSALNVTDKANKKCNKVEQKDSEHVDISTSAKKKNSRKNNKKEEKTEKSQTTCLKSKNCNSNDSADPPQPACSRKKTSFSDYKQTKVSPGKKKNQPNGIETFAKEKPKAQSTPKGIRKIDLTEMSSDSGSDSSKESVKNEKSKKKAKNSKNLTDSLYKKLLNQAKRSIDFKDL